MRTPSSVRSARPRWSSSQGNAYWALVFSHPPALQQEPHLDLVTLPLLEVHDRCARSEVIARIFAGDGIDRVGTEFAATSRLDDRVPNPLPHFNLIDTNRRSDLECRHAGVLADRPFVLGGLVDIKSDDLQRLRRAGFGRLVRDGI